MTVKEFIFSGEIMVTIGWLSLIGLAVVAVVYACRHFGSLEFVFRFKLKARDKNAPSL